MRAEMTSLFIGTNDVTPRSVPSLQFEVLLKPHELTLEGVKVYKGLLLFQKTSLNVAICF